MQQGNKFFDFFRPKWKHSNWRVRREAVEKLTDQELLAKIANTDSNAEVHREAVKKLTDQSLLAKIATTDSDTEVRVSAVNKLTDQSLLARLVETDNDQNVCKAAVRNLTDQSLLARLVETGSNEVVLSAAKALGDSGDKLLLQRLLSINDTKLLKKFIYELPRKSIIEIIHKHPDASVRLYTVNYLVPARQDEYSALINAAKSDSNSDVRIAAVKNIIRDASISDDKKLIETFVRDSNSKIRLTVAEYFPYAGFEDVLKLLCEDVDAEVRQLAICVAKKREERAEQDRKKAEEIAVQRARILSKHPLLGRLESASISEISSLLISTLDSASQGGWVGPDSDQAMVCRLIGEELAKRCDGNTSLMRQVATKELGRFNNCRSLDMWWNGIGNWRG